jgi:predicted ATP-grasp superfamily ATP-dependent carboligase
MRILIFEYINGGGFAKTELPESLAREGGLMLDAALKDFSASGEHELTVLLDSRCLAIDLPQDINIITVTAQDEVLSVFSDAIQNCDAVLPIAPETEQILWTLCSAVEMAGKYLLSSAASAVEKTADKMTTFTILSTHNIPTVPSHLLDQYPHFYGGEGTVIKARDGAGCENCFVCRNEDDFERLLISLHYPQQYLIQPYISGIALSLSVLFKQGVGQLLCVNQQFISIHDNQRLKLVGCAVNCDFDKTLFQPIVDQIARALPDLWGYVGIDLIKRNEQLFIVEINPRLTSSYTGINKALGINVGELLLQLLYDDVQIVPTKNQTVLLNFI